MSCIDKHIKNKALEFIFGVILVIYQQKVEKNEFVNFSFENVFVKI